MSKSINKATLGSTVGTALEWYDFSLYSTASALVFPSVFFPTGSSLTGILASFATFAVGFFARPVGGIIIGRLGDRHGRRQVLFLTLILMGLSSTLIGLLPSAASIGVAAPILLVLLRILQGCGAGGEYAGATLMAAEHSGAETRGLNAAIPGAGNAAGALLATGVLTLLNGVLSKEDFLAWGWRIAFLGSVVVCIAGVCIRLFVSESPEFEKAKAQGGMARVGLKEVLQKDGKNIFLAMLASIGPNVASYLPSVYAITYLANSVGAPAWIGLTGIIIGNLLKFITIPMAGFLSDKFGRRPVFLTGAIGATVLAFPFFFLLNTGTPILVWLALVLIFTFCNDAMLAAQSGFMSELFDVRHRYTAVTFSREIAAAVVGGTLPFIAAALTAAAGGSFWLVAVYCMVLTSAAAIGMMCLPESRRTMVASKGAEESITA